LASTLVEKFGEAATSAAVNQVAATAIPETGGVFDILRNITMAFLLARMNHHLDGVNSHSSGSQRVGK
jgi:hypothetical protein